MRRQIQPYIALLRPFTLLAPFIVSCSMMIASYLYARQTDLHDKNILLLLVPASLCFVMLNGASNALNQATDYIEDTLSKPYRPLPKKILSQKQAFHVSLILYSIAVVLSLCVHILFSLLILIIALFSITYSLPPRMKQKLFINQLWVATPRGFCAVLASWSVFSNPFQPVPVVIGCVATLFLIGGTTTKDILDSDADRVVGTKTMVNCFGVYKTALFSLICMCTSFLMIIPAVAFHMLDSYFLPLTGFFFFGVLISVLMIHHHTNKGCENTSAWSLMYGTYFLFSLSFSFLTIVHTR